MIVDLLNLASDLATMAAAVSDPAAGPLPLIAGLQAVRSLAVSGQPGGAPAPNLDLQPPSDGVPRPTDGTQIGPGGTVAPADLGVSPPFASVGPAGAQGDPGPAGPPGPSGPGIDPARFLALEQAVLDLQEIAFTGLLVEFGGT